MTQKKQLTKRLRPLFIGAFLQSFVFWYAIEKPFLHSLGLDREAMTLVSTVFSASYLISNVPLGVIADRWSRRGILLFGSACLVADCTLAALSHSLLSYAIASTVFGIFIASTNGTYDSIIYDTVLEETGTDSAYMHYFGQYRLAAGSGLAISSLLGGVIGHFIGLRDAYLFSIPAGIFAIIALLGFREPQLHKKAAPQILQKQLGQVIRTALRNKAITGVVISMLLVVMCIFIMNQLDQLWMLALDLPILLYGPVNAILLASTAVGGILSDKAAKSLRGPALVVGSTSAATLLLLIHNLPLVVLAQVLFLGSVTILDTVLSRQLHQAAASHIRSGVSSLISMLGTALFIPIALLFGYVSDRYSVFRATWIVVFIVIGLSISTLYAVYRQPAKE